MTNGSRQLVRVSQNNEIKLATITGSVKHGSRSLKIDSPRVTDAPTPEGTHQQWTPVGHFGIWLQCLGSPVLCQSLHADCTAQYNAYMPTETILAMEHWKN